jgi:hypothetical protein
LVSKYGKDGPPPCLCECHTGATGFFHCFSICCDDPDVVSDPPPPAPEPIKVGPFTKITLPQIKGVVPGTIADIFAEDDK